MVRKEVWTVIGLTVRGGKVAVLIANNDASPVRDTRTVVVESHEAPGLYSHFNVKYEWSVD